MKRTLLVVCVALSASVWAQEAAPKRLNNLTWELANVESPVVGAKLAVENPRDGWVFAAIDADVPSADLELSVEGQEGILARKGGGDGARGEGMRWLPAGKYTLHLRSEAAATVRRVVVRAVPELQYSRVPAEPYVDEHGPYDWSFLERHILPHVNTLLGAADNEHIDEWVSRGGKWITYGSVPHEPGLTADAAYAYWADNPGVRDPRFGGVIADEFQGRQNPLYPVWIEALRRLGKSEAFDDDAFYAYCGGPGMYTRPQPRELVETVFGIHSFMAWERYLHEMPTLEGAQALLGSHLGTEMEKWRATFPGCERRLVMVMPIFTSGLSMNLQPQVDYKAWLDMQVRYYATRPEFDGLFGLQYWTADFADEELLRWAYRLFRHYCIEGSTDSLAEAHGYKYLLDHVTNPDFERGLEGWTVEAAEPGSIDSGYMERLANLQGRYWHRAGTPDEPAGNTFLLLKRHAERANRVSQTIRHLEPGRLYSVKMITADHGDLVRGESSEKRLAVVLRMEGAEVIPEKCFQGTANSRVASGTGEPFTAGKLAWFNQHRVVFRAQQPTAGLLISDWVTDDVPGGDPGQEILCNFVEVQPYYAEE